MATLNSWDIEFPSELVFKLFLPDIALRNSLFPQPVNPITT